MHTETLCLFRATLNHYANSDDSFNGWPMRIEIINETNINFWKKIWNFVRISILNHNNLNLSAQMWGRIKFKYNEMFRIDT